MREKGWEGEESGRAHKGSTRRVWDWPTPAQGDSKAEETLAETGTLRKAPTMGQMVSSGRRAESHPHHGRRPVSPVKFSPRPRLPLHPRSSHVTFQGTKPHPSQPVHRPSSQGHLHPPQSLLQGQHICPQGKWTGPGECSLLVISKSRVKARTRVSRCCRYKQPHLREGSTLSLLLGG